MTLKELSIEHDYYCSDSNYYSSSEYLAYDTFDDFFDDFKDADIDLNLVFRWDVHRKDDCDGYWMEIFIMKQRKGIFTPVNIGRVTESDVPNIVDYLKRHADKLASLWKPLI